MRSASSAAGFPGMCMSASVCIRYLDEEAGIESHALIGVTPGIGQETGPSAAEVDRSVRMPGDDEIRVCYEWRFGDVRRREKGTFVRRVERLPRRPMVSEQHRRTMVRSGQFGLEEVAGLHVKGKRLLV